MATLRELMQQRAALLDQAQAIHNAAEGENRGLTAEEQENFNGLMGQVDGLTERIERDSNLSGARRNLAGTSGQPARPDPSIGLSAEDLQRYSIVRAIRAAASPNQDWTGAEFELEISRAVAERVGRDPNGFFVPAEWMRQRPAIERRDLQVGTASAGGYLVDTDLLVSSFIELLRNRMVLREAGAMVLGDLVGDVDIPKQTGGATAYWVGEGASPTESAQTIGQVGMKPKTVGAFVDITRKLLKQASLDVEAFVRGDLATVLAIAIDRAGLHGSGTGNEPLGVANVSGIGSVVGGTDGAAPDWADVIELETDVSVANADVGRLAYITNAKVRGKLKNTETVSGSGIFCWNTDAAARPGVGLVNGYPAFVTNQVRSDMDKGTSSGVCSGIFFGNWGDLVIGLWGVLDILVDPYTLSTSGGVRVVAMQDVDIAVRHAESFSAMLDALTA